MFRCQKQRNTITIMRAKCHKNSYMKTRQLIFRVLFCLLTSILISYANRPVLFLYGRYRVRKESVGGLISCAKGLCNNQSFQAVNSYSAKFLKNHLEME